MDIKAKATGTEDLGFDGDVEADERALKAQGVQDNKGEICHTYVCDLIR